MRREFGTEAEECTIRSTDPARAEA